MSTSESSPNPAPRNPNPRASKTRTFVLLGLLGLMLFALWYDYKVARPAVEDAYARIGKLNADINSLAGKKYMTNEDVRNELKRSPIRTFSEGGYLVEVYAWRAGLPIKSHEYYAVYTADKPNIFLKHYTTQIDMDELKSLPLIIPADPNAPTGNLVVETGGPPSPSTPGKLNPAPPPSAEPAAQGEGETAAAASSGKSESPAADAKEPAAKAADKPADEKPADEKPSADSAQTKT